MCRFMQSQKTCSVCVIFVRKRHRTSVLFLQRCPWHFHIQIAIVQSCLICCKLILNFCIFITFCVSRRRRKIYCDHRRLCVCLCLCVCLSAAVRPHYCTDPDVTWGCGRACPLIVHYWADLQSGHGLHSYGNITRT